jgi:hypothetical protein
VETLLCVSSDSFLLAALGPEVHPGLPFFIGVSFKLITVGRETIALGDAICMGVFQLTCFCVPFLAWWIILWKCVGESRGDEQFQLAIWVDTGPI